MLETNSLKSYNDSFCDLLKVANEKVEYLCVILKSIASEWWGSASLALQDALSLLLPLSGVIFIHEIIILTFEPLVNDVSRTLFADASDDIIKQVPRHPREGVYPSLLGD